VRGAAEHGSGGQRSREHGVVRAKRSRHGSQRRHGLISLFLPWFTVSDGVFSASVNGLWHGYMYIALILAFAVLAYLVLRAGFEQLPFKLPLGHEQAMLVATAAIFVLTVLSFVFKPAGASDAFASVNWGWSFGAVIGLAAAVVAVLPLGLPFLRSRTGS
jgi:hypothetical protein